MDFDSEIMSGEGDSSEPLFHSIMNAMSVMKEATSDKIYQRVKSEANAKYSKPQVDRALASALKYGIFEVRNNRYRVKDDVLDDEDTIYWQAHMKCRERTPYRLEDFRRDYINPEKDMHTFRKLSVNDIEESVVNVGQRIIEKGTKSSKRKLYFTNKTLKSTEEESKVDRSRRVNKKASKNDGKRENQQRHYPPKYKETEKKISQKALRQIPLKDAKKIRRVIKNTSKKSNIKLENAKVKYGKAKEADSITQFPRDRKSQKKKNKWYQGTKKCIKYDKCIYENDDVGYCDDYCNDSSSADEYNYQKKCKNDSHESVDSKIFEANSNSNQCNSKNHSSRHKYNKKNSLYYKSTKKPFASTIKSRKGNDLVDVPLVSATAEQMQNDSQQQTKIPHEYWNSSCSDRNASLECNLFGTQGPNEFECLAGTYMLDNKTHDTPQAFIKQCDHYLKIEPLDSLPFKNIEETSYIS